MRIVWIVAASWILLNVPGNVAADRSIYSFDRQISRPTLENYLSRAVTFSDLLHGRGNVVDNLRFLTNTGAKFVGRAIYRWGGEAELPALLARATPIAIAAHESDPDLILQAACFEIISQQVDQLPVPEWVFLECNQPVERRNFRYSAMLYPEGHLQNHWGPEASVPDMSRPETQLWFLYLAGSYIKIGIEAIHFGQVELMDHRDRDHTHWRRLLARVRAYASRHARRHLILCDAHVPSGGIVHEGQLLFDLHSFPLRIDEVVDKPEEGVLKIGYLDSLFGRSKGGATPSGWTCEHLPFLVELDNFEPSGREGQNIGQHWIWGYDEISWFAHQSEAYRNQWLRYASEWIQQHDTNGWLQMPGSRTLSAPVDGKHWYWANSKSTAVPDGFSQESTIKTIWQAGNHGSNAGIAPTPEKDLRHSVWEGYDRLDFQVAGRASLLIVPKASAPGSPWIWRTEFFGHEPQGDLSLLGKGFHVAYTDVQNLYGAPKALDHMDLFYSHVTNRFGLGARPVLEGLSRGGLFAFNWAARHPTRVTCLYVDAPVCDFKSWPAGWGKGPGSPSDWARCKEVYGLTDEQARAYAYNPVDNLAPLAAHHVPILSICGDADEVVPFDENTQVVQKRYSELDGPITVIVKPGVKHHPHSLKDPAPIVEFILKASAMSK